MALSRTLQALDADLRRDNDARRRQLERDTPMPRGFAPTAPMPHDPLTCRWCGGGLRALYDGGPEDYCQSGCARNDVAPYLADCTACGLAFHTGEHMASTCHGCKRAATATMRPAFEPMRGDWVERNERRREQREDSHGQ